MCPAGRDPRMEKLRPREETKLAAQLLHGMVTGGGGGGVRRTGRIWVGVLLTKARRKEWGYVKGRQGSVACGFRSQLHLS